MKYVTGARISAVLMTIVSATCVGVQYNDPDGWVWMLVYMYAVGVGVLGIADKYSFWCVAGGTAYLLLGIFIMPWRDLNSDLFGTPHWHMGPDSNEEAREAGGLFILSLWMFAMSWVWWRRRHPKTVTAEVAED